MAIERFEDIEAWKAARKLAADVYAVCNDTDLAKDFGLKDQLRRAAGSVMANIAEGFDSRLDHEFVRFLSYAYRSASKLQSHLYITLDQGYLDEVQFGQLYADTVGVKKLLNGFIRYLKQKPAGQPRPSDPEPWVTNYGPRTPNNGPRTKEGDHVHPHS